MTAPPPTDWIDQGQNAVWFFGAAFAGFLRFIFGQPIKAVNYKKPPPKTKHAKRKRNKTKYLPKPSKEKKENGWAKLPKYTPEDHARINAYYAKRDGKKTDEWRSNIPQ